VPNPHVDRSKAETKPERQETTKPLETYLHGSKFGEVLAGHCPDAALRPELAGAGVAGEAAWAQEEKGGKTGRRQHNSSSTQEGSTAACLVMGLRVVCMHSAGSLSVLLLLLLDIPPSTTAVRGRQHTICCLWTDVPVQRAGIIAQRQTLFVL
jgi:hypothetical protein